LPKHAALNKSTNDTLGADDYSDFGADAGADTGAALAGAACFNS